jgi:hypothetical protein
MTGNRIRFRVDAPCNDTNPPVALTLRAAGGSPIVTGRGWRPAWGIVALALLGLGACASTQGPVAPPPPLPRECIDEFSGHPTRSCL